MSHGQTRIHHGPDLGETTTFPLIIYYVPLHEAHIQMHFVSGFQNESPEILKVKTPTTLGPHNLFMCKPPIEMKFEAKL